VHDDWLMPLATVLKIFMFLLDKNSPAEMASLTFLLIWIRMPIGLWTLDINLILAFVIILEYSILGEIGDNYSHCLLVVKHIVFLHED